MVEAINKDLVIGSGRRTKVETTYEYVPLLGDIIGYWRKVNEQRMGDELILNVMTPLEKYDHVFINGKEINF